MAQGVLLLGEVVSHDSPRYAVLDNAGNGQPLLRA